MAEEEYESVDLTVPVDVAMAVEVARWEHQDAKLALLESIDRFQAGATHETVSTLIRAMEILLERNRAADDAERHQMAHLVPQMQPEAIEMINRQPDQWAEERADIEEKLASARGVIGRMTNEE